MPRKFWLWHNMNTVVLPDTCYLRYPCDRPLCQILVCGWSIHCADRDTVTFGGRWFKLRVSEVVQINGFRGISN